MIDADILATLPLTSHFSPTTRLAIVEHAFICEYEAGKALWAVDTHLDHLVVVLEGQVRIVREVRGRKAVVHTEGPGGTLGEVPLFASGPTRLAAIAMERTRCLIITRRGIEIAMAMDPQVVWVLLQRMALRVRILVDRLDHIERQNSRSRLAALLIHMAEEAGIEGSADGISPARLAG